LLTLVNTLVNMNNKQCIFTAFINVHVSSQCINLQVKKWVTLD